ncbi:MAG: CoA transferase [Pseudomonadota bacterium]|nr:CoA transferase [Pseudomonadota bacterium]
MATLLKDIKVIELSHVMAAPTCGLMLADMGAEVIKVERLPDGDNIRKLGPFSNGVSGPFTMMNRNKKGVALNLHSETGKEVLKKLILGADVFIENYRAGAMENYGVGYHQVKNENTRLIYCSISGFGRTGVFSERGGFDLVAQGMSGIMSITGEGEDRPPVKVGAPITDISAGNLAAMGILAALVSRNKTGRGQYVDTSLFEAGIMHTYWQSSIYLGSGEVPKAMGSAHPLMAPYQAFRTKDGWINLGSANQGLWEKLILVLGAQDLLEDNKYKDPKSRLDNINDLESSLTKYFLEDTTDNWVRRLEKEGVPSGPVLDIAEMTQNQQTLDREMIKELPGDNALRVIGHPVKFSESSTEINYSAPELGEHTREVMHGLGYSSEQVKELIELGAVVCSD